MPLCGVVLALAVPEIVQPLRLPVSNPPFTIPDPPDEVIASDSVAVWVADAPVPVIVRV